MNPGLRFGMIASFIVGGFILVTAIFGLPGWPKVSNLSIWLVYGCAAFILVASFREWRGTSGK